MLMTTSHQTDQYSSSASAYPSQPPKLTKALLWVVTLLIFCLGIGLRLYDITDEPIDFHPTRQLRGAIIARGMYYQDLPDVDPETRALAISHWNSTGQYEPSILEFLASRVYLLIGSEQIWVARAINTFFWTIGGIALFDLGRRLSAGVQVTQGSQSNYIAAWVTALIALGYYMVNPFGVQASRSFQPDPGMVMWIILTIYSLYRWSTSKSWVWAVLAGLFGGIAILTKAVSAYIIAGGAIGLVLYTMAQGTPQTRDASLGKRILQTVKRIVFNPQVWVMIALMIVPMIIYYSSRSGRASQYFSSWTVSLSHLLLDPATYVRWLRLVESLMGLVVLLIALVGVLIARPRDRALLLGLWIGYVVYGLFLPYQMYTHNYYHIQLIPIIALSLVPVTSLVVSAVKQQSWIWQVLAVAITSAILLYTSWLAVYPLHSEDYRHERAYWQEIGSFLPTDGKIIGLTQDYGYRLMYYGWQKVTLWPPRGEIQLAKLRGSEKEFEEYFAKRIDGKNYFLITAFNQFEDQPVLRETLYARFPVFAEGPGYLIFDLTRPNSQDTP